MNWKNLFKPSEILTQTDREELEQVEKRTLPFVKVREKIEKDFVMAPDRIGRLQAIAEDYIKNIQDESLYQRMLTVAGMPSHPATGYQHHSAVAVPFDQKIEEILNDSVPVVRRVLGRALSRAEDELRKIEKKEQDEAKTEGYAYLPSGKVQALQQRVLGLRNAVNEKYRFEGSTQNPPHWRERLAEWL